MTDSFRHKGLRKRLVQELREQGIRDEVVLKAIESIPRHLFIDPSFEAQAYENIPFPIDRNQTISNPFTVAYQSQLLGTGPGDKVLEIGTGSGYQAAVLAELGAEVYTIERHLPLSEKARKLLVQRGYTSIHCIFGDGFAGFPEAAPFDQILITAAAPEIPNALLKQLAVGGVLVIPLVAGANQQMLRITRKSEKNFEKEKLDEFSFVPMLKGISP